MRLHWYWPFVREDELAMANAVLRDEDTVCIEAIDRVAAPAAGANRSVTVVRDLPDVNRDASKFMWAPSRAVTYYQRTRVRSHHWKSGQYDLFHLHYLNRYTDALAKFPKPLVMSVHDAVPHVPRLGSQMEHRLLKRVYGRPAALIVHHDRVAEELFSDFSVSDDRVHVVPYPVLTGRRTTEPPPDGPPTVLLFGALRPNKGLRVLDEAIRILGGEDIRFVIAGRGHRELEMQALSMQASDPRITAEIGYVSLERKGELFRQATIAVLPYTSFSSQSAVLHDAYGFGRPVVVTNVGALGETVVEDRTGLVAGPGDATDLADKILAMLNAVTWERSAAACAAVAEARTPEAFGKEIRRIYERLLNN